MPDQRGSEGLDCLGTLYVLAARDSFHILVLQRAHSCSVAGPSAAYRHMPAMTAHAKQFQLNKMRVCAGHHEAGKCTAGAGSVWAHLQAKLQAPLYNPGAVTSWQGSPCLCYNMLLTPFASALLPRTSTPLINVMQTRAEAPQTCHADEHVANVVL